MPGQFQADPHRRGNGDVSLNRNGPTLPLPLPLPMHPYSRRNNTTLSAVAISPKPSRRVNLDAEGCGWQKYKSPNIVVKYAHLDAPILSLVSQISLADSEVLARTQVIRTIQEAVSRLDPAVVAQPFGSFCVGLSLASSDIDIALVRVLHPSNLASWWELPPPDSQANAYEKQPETHHEHAHSCDDCRPLVQHLSIDQVSAVLHETPSTFNIFCIKAGANPKIMLTVSHDVPSAAPISVEITAASFQSPTHCAAACHHPGICVGEFVKAVLRDYPDIASTVMVLRAVLRNRALDDTQVGGLGAYPLFIMIYYWTRFRGQSSETVKFGRAGEEGELGRKLVEFLRWSSTMVQWDRMALGWTAASDAAHHFDPTASARCASGTRSQMPEGLAPTAAVIIDPLNPSINVAAVGACSLRILFACNCLRRRVHLRSRECARCSRRCGCFCRKARLEMA